MVGAVSPSNPSLGYSRRGEGGRGRGGAPIIYWYSPLPLCHSTSLLSQTPFLTKCISSWWNSAACTQNNLTLLSGDLFYRNELRQYLIIQDDFRVVWILAFWRQILVGNVRAADPGLAAAFCQRLSVIPSDWQPIGAPRQSSVKSPAHTGRSPNLWLGVSQSQRAGKRGGHYEAILGFFANSQDCSQSKVLESLFSADLASPCSQKRRFYMIDFIRRYIWSKI